MRVRWCVARASPCSLASTPGYGGRVHGTPSYGHAAVGGGEASVAAYIALSKKKIEKNGGAAAATCRLTQAERLMLLAEVDAAAASVKARCDKLASLTAQALGRAT